MNISFKDLDITFDCIIFQILDPLLSSVKIETLETRVVPCPYRQSLLANEISVNDYAELYLPTTRTWSNSTFLSGLSDSRT